MNQSPEIQNSNFKIHDSAGKRQIWNLEFGITNLLITLILGFASLLLYLRTLAPDVVDADGGEFQFAAWNFGIVHPTGYPLYLILGGAFQHLVPIGNPAFRLNLFTAITAALAVAMVFFVAHKITRHRGASILAAAAFGLTRVFWYDAGAAETYALNAFFVALLILLALRWQANPSAKSFSVFCFGLGLALTHHRTIALWLPAFALFFVISSLILRLRSGQAFHASRFPSYFLILAFSFLLPLLLYLYIPLRASASPYYTLSLAPNRNLILYDNSFTGFINTVLGRTFQSEIGWDAVSVARLAAFPQLLLDQFGAIGVALGMLGFVALAWRREWARFALLLAGFAATILFASIYHIGDIFHYYIPAYLAWSLWIGYAIKSILNLAARFSPHAPRFVSVFCLLLTAFFLLVPQFLTNFSFADRRGETRAREHWTRLLSNPIPPNAILISNDRDEMMPLWYIQYVENTRRDVVGLFPLITSAPEHTNVVRLTDSILNTGRPVYFIKPMPGLEIKYRIESAEPLVRVLGRATDRLPQNTSDAVIAGRVRVIGYDVVREANILRVAIFWQPLEKLDANYTSFAHLLDARGNKLAQGNDHPVGGEFYPTSLWNIGETLRDEQVIALPPDVARGAYSLRIGMYRQLDGAMLGEPVVIGAVEIR